MYILIIGAIIEFVDFGFINSIQEQLLINVKHQMTYMYFQYSRLGLDLFDNIFYPNYIIHILLETLHMDPRGI